jgi:hypothetical protein
MHPSYHVIHSQLRRLFILAALLFLPAALRAADSSGSVTGTVSNTATGNNLEGARVEIPRLGLSVLTNNSGQYVFTGVPAGDHELVATYIGLDPARVTVTVAAGARVTRNFDMTRASTSSRPSRSPVSARVTRR